MLTDIVRRGPGVPLTAVQRSTFAACFLGWTLDAFDFFLLTLCLRSVAAEFHATLPMVAEAIFWTLAMRPLGALLFGLMAERYGRRPTLMINVVSFSVFELLSAFAPSLPLFLLCRALFGIAMGGALPALLAFYLRFKVEESPAWLASRQVKGESAGQPTKTVVAIPGRSPLWRYLPSLLFLALLMTAFTSFSHGTQDLYPSMLEHDRGMKPGMVGLLTAIGNFGALAGGIVCGTLSERWGRRRTIVVASLLAIPMIPLWSGSSSIALLAVGGFLMQFMVQGAWGVIPAHLNELSPGPVRATFPGFAYQLGNLLSSKNGVVQATLAIGLFGGRLSPVLSRTVILVAIVVAVLTALGREAKGASLTNSEATVV